MDDNDSDEAQIAAWNEIAAQGLIERLDAGTLNRDTAYSALRDFAHALTHAPCGCAFYASPRSTEADWLMKYCAKHAG